MSRRIECANNLHKKLESDEIRVEGHFVWAIKM
jgi:hypothetical protein